MSLNRPYNFGAGPAAIATDILLDAKDELLDWHAEGMSVMEISHRSKPFMALLEGLQQQFRDVLDIPDNYHVLFLGTPARFQFEMIAMNFLSHQADYLVTGYWSKLAYDAATHFGKARLAASNEATNYLTMPSEIQALEDADYFYCTLNETLTGFALDDVSRLSDKPIICDMTSCLLSEPIDVSQYGLIFAGQQKNLGPAGATVVIVRDDLLQSISNKPSSYCDYRLHAKHASNYATPPTFNIYMMAKVLDWVKQQGGLGCVGETNHDKARQLYQFIDDSDFYDAMVSGNNRSIMNVTFRLNDESRNENFLSSAKANGLLALKGHRAVGGMRASIYNAMPMDGVLALIAFMDEFAKTSV